MPTQVQCPDCRTVNAVPDEHPRRTIRCSACGVKFLLPRDAEPETGLPILIDRYQVRTLLGKGAFGAVYRAYDPRLERDVALKVLRPEKMATPQAVERFLREARAAARLHHPHIVPVFDAGRAGDVNYIASAYIPGRTLHSAIPESGMEPHRAAALTAQLAEALGYAHRQGVLHRDVKPQNILLDETGAAHLTDFGLAGWMQEESTRLTQAGTVMGTPAYMSPEQASGDTVHIGPASDLYSAGVVLYKLLTGRLPFEGGPWELLLFQIVHRAPPPPSEFQPNLDPGLEAVCLKAMAKDPVRRYQSGEEMAAALASWAATPPPVAQLLAPTGPADGRPSAVWDNPTSSYPPRQPEAVPQSRSGRKWLLWGGGIAVGTAALAVAAVLVVAAMAVRPVPPTNTAPEDGGPKPTLAHTTPTTPGGAAPKTVPDVKPKEKSPAEVVNSFGMRLKWIAPGHFLMGSPEGEGGRGSDETQHPVEITRPFYLAVYPVTQGEYVQVTGRANPSWFTQTGSTESLMAGTDATKCPVDWVSWYEAVAFCEALNKQDAKRPAGWKYGLPTEAQWEYACRAGTTTAYSFGDNPGDLGDFAWYAGNAAVHTHQVGGRKPNLWGLYDMHGHIWQWCADRYAADTYRNSPRTDPPGPQEGVNRVLRGGSWLSPQSSCRSAVRWSFPASTSDFSLARSSNTIGLRVGLFPEP